MVLSIKRSGEIQLPMNFSFRDVVKSWDGCRCACRSVAFGVFALYDRRKLAGVDTDYERIAERAFSLRMSRILGVPESPAIVEGDGDLCRRADLVNGCTERRVGFVFFGG